MTVRTNHIALGDFRGHPFPGETGLSGRDGHVKALDLPRAVVEVHDVMRETSPAVGTRHVLGLPDGLAIPLHAPVLQLGVVLLMPPIIVPLVKAVTGATPMLRLAVGPNAELGQGQASVAFRTHFHTNSAAPQSG